MTLINKTKEKGVRQLKSGLENIFDYCLLQWTEEAIKGKTESKIKIDSELVDRIISHDFINIDLDDDNKKKTLEDKNQFLFISIIFVLIIWGVYGIVKTLKLFENRNKKTNFLNNSR